MERKRGRALMVLGTASHVGKSLLTAAFCRILAQDGYRVAPFKAQNMSLNSAATPEGGEIGRAQALQAEAAGVAPHVDMNPILLKPTGERGSQVVVLGKVFGDVSAREYHTRRVKEFAPIVHAAYERVAADRDFVVLEGAGSPAELNLRDGDLVNLSMAHAANATCVLVADIDRGGVFGALYGTIALLEPEDRALIAGTIVNRFRGDPSLFTSGVTMLETRTQKPCFGVVPFLRDIGLDEEDGVAHDGLHLATRAPWNGSTGSARKLRVAVIALPQLANFTDFDALAAEPSVELAYVADPAALVGADLVILPGTKTTLAALRFLRERKFTEAIVAAARDALVFGICGGMQILGTRIADPHDVEGGGDEPGLGILPIATTLAPVKVTERARGTLAAASLFGIPIANARAIDGYEIHCGRTAYLRGANVFANITRESDARACDDGAISGNERTVGTYLHGALANDAFRQTFVAAARAASGLTPPSSFANVAAERESRIDRLAAHVRASVDMPRILAAVRGDALNLRILACALAADLGFGDPAWFPHPVRLLGRAATRAERRVRHFAKGDARRERIGGFGIVLVIVGGAAFATSGIRKGLRKRNDVAADVFEGVLGWTSIAIRDLLSESASVRDALEADDLSRARTRVARIVGRDTAELSSDEVARATIETLAESLCDGIVAPMFALAIGGAPAALAFKAASTLDSMLGHIEPPYTELGYAAAKLDDVLCWLPARIAALAVVLVAPIARGRIDVAFATLRADGARHASPNAGRPEAAMAGALGVRLGGGNRYASTFVDAPALGDAFASPCVADVRRAERVTLAASFACAFAALALRAALDAR